MSFCSNCGKQVPGESRFCPGCGTEVRSAQPAPASPAAAPSPKKGTAKTGVLGTEVGKARRIIGCMDVALIVLTLFPWVKINLYLWSGEYSLPSLIQLIGNAQSQASSLLGSYWSGSEIGANVTMFVVVLALAWVGLVASLGFDAYSYFASGTRKFRSVGPVVAIVLALIVLVACFELDVTISGGSGSGLAGMITATGWVWLTLGVAAVELIYIGATDPARA